MATIRRSARTAVVELESILGSTQLAKAAELRDSRHAAPIGSAVRKASKFLGRTLMTRSIVFLFAALLFSVRPASAGPDGNQVLRTCQQTITHLDDQPDKVESLGYLDSGWCVGWVTAVIEINNLHRELADKSHPVSADMFYFCSPPEGLTALQAIRIVVQYLRAHPQQLDQNAMALTSFALMSAFPCKAK